MGEIISKVIKTAIITGVAISLIATMLGTCGYRRPDRKEIKSETTTQPAREKSRSTNASLDSLILEKKKSEDHIKTNQEPQAALHQTPQSNLPKEDVNTDHSSRWQKDNGSRSALEHLYTSMDALGRFPNWVHKRGEPLVKTIRYVDAPVGQTGWFLRYSTMDEQNIRTDFYPTDKKPVIAVWEVRNGPKDESANLTQVENDETLRSKRVGIGNNYDDYDLYALQLLDMEGVNTNYLRPFAGDDWRFNLDFTQHGTTKTVAVRSYSVRNAPLTDGPNYSVSMLSENSVPDNAKYTMVMLEPPRSEDGTMISSFNSTTIPNSPHTLVNSVLQSNDNLKPNLKPIISLKPVIPIK